MMKELVAHIAACLVDNAAAVAVEEKEGDDGAVVIELRVAKEDLGKVIGRQGRTARAMRTLLSALPGEEQQQVALKIVE